MNEELNHIFRCCDANKLSVNINKANFMVITSSKRRECEIQLIRDIKQKNYIKYLGIYRGLPKKGAPPSKTVYLDHNGYE